MSLDDLIARLSERYDECPPTKVRQRRRKAPLDEFLPQMRSFTMRRVYAPDPREFSLSKLSDAIERDSSRRFCATAIRKALIEHKLYQLWRL
ncbi:hypothetical protein P3T16_006362 [Paraburkholderia sp. GAS42]|jgi:hypothetical protein